MYTKRFTRKLTRPFLFISALLLLAATAWLPSSTAYAQDDNPPGSESDAARRGQRVDERLGKLYQRELEWLDRQAERLENPEEVAGRVEEWISTASEKGLDVSALQSALAVYQSSIAQAEAAHAEADAILAAHAGFDENGKVTDREAARDTLDSAGHKLNEARRILNDAIHQLRHAVRDWLRAQRPQP